MIKVTAPKDRSVRLRSSAGVSIHLTPGQTRTVAPMFNADAAHQGCAVQPVGMDDPAPQNANPDGVDMYFGSKDRATKIREAVEALIADGDSSELTSAGNPRTAAVRNRSGVDDVTASDIQAALQNGDG